MKKIKMMKNKINKEINSLNHLKNLLYRINTIYTFFSIKLFLLSLFNFTKDIFVFEYNDWWNYNQIPDPNPK